MTTGDIKNNIRKLISELKQVSYDIHAIDYHALIHGIPSAFLPIIHHTLLDYSHDIASYLAKRSYQLYAKNDLRFVETVYKILLQEFSYKPSLTKEQFLALGFAERKIILITDIVKFCREKNKSICNKKKPAKSSHGRGNHGTKGYSGQENQNMPAKYVDGRMAKETNTHKNSKVMESSSLNKNLSLSSNESDEREDEHENMSKSKEQCIEGAAVRNGLPVPNLGPFGWSTKSDIENTIPKPCESLIVTPLKDVENGMERVLESVPRNSRADVIEVENIKPQGFKVINHNIIQSKSEQNERHVEEERLKITHAENEDESSSLHTSGFFVPEQSESRLVSNFVCRCNCNETVSALQDQMISLQHSLKDLVTMNNELSARIVLLETQNKLMEKKIESITDTTENEDNQHGLAPKELTVQQLGSIRKIPKNKWNDRGIQHKTEVAEYSPDKYVDNESSLPEDFQPIKVAGMIGNAMGNATEVSSNLGDENEIAEGNTVMTVAEEKKSGELQHNDTETISAESGREIHSPLHENEFPFMEEQTRVTVLNLQKKLEETMNLFKM